MIRVIKKFKILLDRKERKKIIFIGFLMVIGGLLETLGVSAIVPLVKVLMDETFVFTNKYTKAFCAALGITTVKGFLIVFIIVLIVIFVAKGVFIFAEYNIQIKYIYRNRLNMQHRMMSSFLHRSYEYYLNANSGEIMRVMNGDIINAFSLLSIILSFFTEMIVSAFLLIAIFIIDIEMALSTAAILLVEVVIIYLFIKPVLRRLGKITNENSALAYKWMLESINCIKDVKVAQKEDYFVNKYVEYEGRTVTSDRKRIVLGNLPRLMIETVTISFMLVVILFMLFGGRSLEGILPQLSAFALAAVRLIPSVNRVSVSFNSIAYQEISLDNTIENLKYINSRDDDTEYESCDGKLTLKSACQLKNITYCYPNSEKPVLKNADMDIPLGSSVGIVGSSGAGKTTTVDILLGLLNIQEGEILCDGISIIGRESEWLSHISYIPQTIHLIDASILENIALGEEKDDIDESQVWEALKEANIDEYVKSLPDGIYTTVGEQGVRLSGGQRQRLGIARALFAKPEILVFDEATSALDSETEKAIIESVNELKGKVTMIIIAHRLSTIESCDMVYRVENGTIIRER